MFVRVCVYVCVRRVMLGVSLGVSLGVCLRMCVCVCVSVCVRVHACHVVGAGKNVVRSGKTGQGTCKQKQDTTNEGFGE